MKIRKGLLAAATATSVALTGVVAAPANADDKTPTPTVVNADGKSAAELNAEAELMRAAQKAARTERISKGLESEDFKERSSARTEQAFTDDYGRPDPGKITAWIALFTTVLGAIGTLINFVNKNIKR